MINRIGVSVVWTKNSCLFITVIRTLHSLGIFVFPRGMLSRQNKSTKWMSHSHWLWRSIRSDLSSQFLFHVNHYFSRKHERRVLPQPVRDNWTSNRPCNHFVSQTGIHNKARKNSENLSVVVGVENLDDDVSWSHWSREAQLLTSNLKPTWDLIHTTNQHGRKRQLFLVNRIP